MHSINGNPSTRFDQDVRKLLFECCGVLFQPLWLKIVQHDNVSTRRRSFHRFLQRLALHFNLLRKACRFPRTLDCFGNGTRRHNMIVFEHDHLTEVQSVRGRSLNW